MARYKPQETHSLLLPVVLSEQIEPGSFTFALSYLVDHELDFTGMDAQFKNDEVGASVYDPRVMCQRLPGCPRRVRAFQSADAGSRRACRDDDRGVAGDSGCGVGARAPRWQRKNAPFGGEFHRPKGRLRPPARRFGCSKRRKIRHNLA